MDPSYSLSSSPDFPVTPVIRVPFPPLSRRDEEGLSSCFGASLPSCCRFNPARVNRHISQSATIHAAFALRQSARPLGLRLFEATSAFTLVTARWLAHHPVDGVVDRFQRFGFPLLRYPSYEAPDFCLGGSVPHWTLQPFLDTLPDGRISQVRFEALAVSSVSLPFRREVQALARIRPDREWFARSLVPSHASA